MSASRNQDFLRGTPEEQARIVNVTAAAVIATIAAVVVGLVWIRPLFDEPDGLELTLDVPYAGPGVGEGTKVILHGAEVGEVTALLQRETGPVQMDLLLDRSEIEGLTDSFDIDFRPQNYFGVTAVNLVSKPGGSDLVSGQVYDRMPTGDFTMSTMLEQGSLTIGGTLTDDIITSLDKLVRYTDGMTPLIESGVIFADHVAQTQQNLPTDLMDRFNDMLDVMPAFADQAILALYNAFDTKFNLVTPDGNRTVDDEKMSKAGEGLGLVSTKVFSSVGNLLASHSAELTPGSYLLKALTDAMPHLLDGGTSVEKLGQLAAQLNGAFSGPEDARTLNLRLVVDGLAGLPQVEGPR